MWESFKTGTGPSIHQQPPPELKNRPFLRQTQSSSSNSSHALPQSRSTTSVSSSNSRSNKSRDSNYDNQTYLQDDFENRLNGLGIQNGPFRYEIRRGKTVRQPYNAGQPRLSPALGSDDIRAKAPPRNPRRLQGEDDSPWRPASSVYPDDEFKSSNRQSRHLNHRLSRSKAPAKDMYGRPMAGEISPPSSPELDATRYGPNSQDVSPIDESPNLSQLDLLGERRITPRQSQTQLRSQIPTMRRDKPTSPGQQPSTLRTTRSTDQLADITTPWETMQPPPGSSDNPQQTFGLTTVVTGPQRTSSGNPSPSLGQRIRKFARAKPEPVETRPPWNGASGRAPMVDPVRDDLTVAPLSLQRRVSKRVGLGANQSPETPSVNTGTVRRLLPSRSTQKLKEAYKTPSPEPASHSYPSPPNTGSPTSQPTITYATAAPMLSPHMVPDQLKAVKRKPSPSTHNPHTSWSSSVYSAITEDTLLGNKPLLNSIESAKLSTPEDPWVQPASRFSVTTCNTAAAESPRLSDNEGQASPPDTPKQAPSVMDRRRPVPGGDNFRRASNVPIIISMKSASSLNERPASIVSTDKALPPAPPEMQSANDRVAYLTARLDSLAHRRNNINKSIKQMTELMPTDRLLSSTDVIRKREVEKKKVEGLKEELSEIQREEHDLGLKLYRANKRLEREAAFEPSSLWVRRITSE
ncbi:hypothetical protein F53441_1116 [Fusarium austroafricanum]|uniref:Uncharacterized protein n=1 Tax=Fusarium austroafricanum TaxID=2364996 RepID=A0A8H4KWA7_9HYPO|nr:hypothetical protein F53441_1116 [Fusarium austroafricanum]